MKAWAAGKQSSSDAAPEKLIYPLEHAYTAAELSFDTLKGTDAAVQASWSLPRRKPAATCTWRC